jgi:hypothetical protein
MLAPYVKVRVSTDGRAKLISFEIPGVTLQLLQEEGKPLQAFGEGPEHSVENLVHAAKYAIDMQMAQIAGARYSKPRIDALEQVKRYMDALLTHSAIEILKHRPTVKRRVAMTVQ